MKKLFVLGDSISMHYGPYLEEELSGIMEYDRKGKNENFGDLNYVSDANGGDSGNCLEYIRDYFTKDYDIMLLNTGLHDIKTTDKKQVSEDKYKANLEEIISLVRAKGKELIFVTTTPVIDEIHNSRIDIFKRFNSDVIKYNEIAKEVMARLLVPVIDLYSFTEKLEGDIYMDHVHYIDEVKKLQAEFIKSELIKLV